MIKKLILVALIVIAIGSLGFLGGYTVQDYRVERVTDVALELQENLGKTEIALNETKAELKRTADLNLELQENLEKVEKKLIKAKRELHLLREGDRYELHDPTFKEVRQFIQKDDTDKKIPTKDYVCINFSMDVNKHAMKQGLRCAEVLLDFKKVGHAIVAFETIDRGLIYVEPQLDVIIPELKVGQKYWDIIEKYSNYEVKKSHDDTIKRILILW